MSQQVAITLRISCPLKLASTEVENKPLWNNLIYIAMFALFACSIDLYQCR